MTNGSNFFETALKSHFGEDAQKVYAASPLLQYLKIKTKSVDKSSKSRANFGNLYAIFVLVEDYLTKGYYTKGDYSKYRGADFSNLFRRQRELPYGSKLQNHALNHRCNQEFHKFFKETREEPIIRNLATKKYWINENLLVVQVNSNRYNLAKAIIEIIQTYATLRTQKFESFFGECLKLREKPVKDQINKFVTSQLMPNVDARIFEIVSFCILKNYYAINKLTLYKTGRTNANDGGIDFVMRPKGRFFQVSEVLDFKKYFLDIDKILRFPITFVIKSEKSPEYLRKLIEEKARQEYDKQTLEKYMNAIEEVISIPTLVSYLKTVLEKGSLTNLLEDLIRYYKVEFNIV
jgi:hypothetical protein